MASKICSNCGIFGEYNPSEIRGHDYPCARKSDGIVVIITKGNIFAGIEAK